MHRRPIVTWILVVGSALALTACTPADEASDPFDQVQQAYEDAETGEEWLPAAREFLEGHPDHEEVSWVTARVLYHQGDEMGDQAGAVDTVMAAFERAEDPEVRFEIATQVADEAADLGRTIDIAAVATDLAAVRPLTFSENLEVMEDAAEFGEWSLVAEAATTGLDQATPETYRADYPDREVSDEEARARADRRRGMALAWLGWAQVQQDQVEEGMATFEQAAEVMPTNYFGVANDPLPRLWGRALLETGATEAGVEKLAATALFAGDWQARELLDSTLAEREDGDAVLASVRDQYARPLDNVTLADYDGEEHSLAALRDDKVMLLAFWFPT